jgi:hypothetical protein
VAQNGKLGVSRFFGSRNNEPIPKLKFLSCKMDFCNDKSGFSIGQKSELPLIRRQVETFQIAHQLNKELNL